MEELLKQILDDISSAKQEKVTLTISDCVEICDIGRGKLFELANNPNSDFPCFRVGKKILVNKAMFLEWLKKITEEKRIL